MALARMCKARIAVHNTAANELAGKLQNLGCCEFSGVGEGTLEVGAAVAMRAKEDHLNSLLSDVKFLVRLLEPFETNKESSFAQMLGDIPEVSLDALASGVDEAAFSSFVTEMRDKEKSLAEYRADITRLKGLQSQLAPFESVKWPLEMFSTGTSMVIGVIYSLPKASEPEFVAKLKEKLKDMAEYQTMPCGKGKDAAAMCAVLFQRSDEDLVQEVALEFSANKIDVPKEFVKQFSEEQTALTEKIKSTEEKETHLLDVIKSKADGGLKMARRVCDYWTIQKDRVESMISGIPTEKVIIWSIWLPEDCLEKVKATVKQYESLTEFAVVEPDEGEMPPTLLKNPNWSACVEPLTLMYGTPTYGTVDPTTMMAPFFFVFMGMCFGDAGYGLILSGVFGYFLIRHQLPPTIKKFFQILLIGMFCSVVMGALTGSWFGDSIDAFPFLSFLRPLKSGLQILDPMKDPMTFLVISLALGFAHVIFGLMIACASNWSNGDKKAAVLDQMTWIIFLLGIVLLGLSVGNVLPGSWLLPSKIMTYAGALALVLTQGREKRHFISKLISGVLSLYNVTGYLGDVLSYSRLLALGLSSAAIGMVINLLCTLVYGVPYVGMFLAVLVFVVGHGFSIAVNILGAFVHSLRLQYVEFFGKFYEANGKDFTPLKNSPQYVRLVGEK